MPDPGKSLEKIENLSDILPDGASEDEQLLAEDLRPGPDTPVIRKVEREDVERGWFLGVFLALLILTITGDATGSALLPARAWAQMKPEIADIRTFLFQVAGVIIGFYFGTAVRRRGRS